MQVSESARQTARRETAARAKWFERNIKIIDINNNLTPLRLRPQQLHALYLKQLQRACGLPVRQLILKPRRIGFSTLIEADMFFESYFVPFQSGAVIAHLADSSENIFQMAKLMEESLPQEKRRKLDKSSVRGISFAHPHLSKIRVFTAGGKEMGRSYGINYLHMSEVAFYERMQSVLGLLQTIQPLDTTAIIKETTANGVGEPFYQEYVAAVERLKKDPNSIDGALPLFFSWLDFPLFQRELPEGYTLDDIDDIEVGLKQLGATDKQLYWRRWKIAGDCLGDPDYFKQEFPATWQEAFITSGRPGIPQDIVSHHRELCEPPKRKVKFVWYDNKTKVYMEDSEDGLWHIWKDVDEFHDYTVFGDVAEGKLTDPTTDYAKGTNEPDFSTGAVFDRAELEYVATLRTRNDPDVHGEELKKAAIYYNQAWASPEVNNAGWSTLSAMRDYPKLYQREGDKDEVVENRILQRYGWRTTDANRNDMIDSFIAGCRKDPMTGYEGKIRLYDNRIVDEEMTFIYDKMGKRQHRPGAHDDMMFACFGAWQLHLRCPRRLGGRWYDSNLFSLDNNSVPAVPLGYVGGRDDFSDILDE